MTVIKNDTGTRLTDTGPSAWLEMTVGAIQTFGTWTGTLVIQTDATRTVDTGAGDTGGFSQTTDATGSAESFTGNINLRIDNGIPLKTRLFFTPSDTGADLRYVLNGVNHPAGI